MSTTITAACGEHFVASFLSGVGLIVALPRAGVPGSDLLVASCQCGPALRIQVKTARDARGRTKALGDYYSWDTSAKVVDLHSEHLWFAYVSLNGWPSSDGLPEVFFIPSSVIAEHLRTHPKSTRPLFWLQAADLEQYIGATGLRPIMTRLGC